MNNVVYEDKDIFMGVQASKYNPVRRTNIAINNPI